jgi:hypothetical protein
MAPSTQADQVAQPMRVRPTTTGKMMHLLALSRPTMLAHTTGPVPHLLPPHRIHRVTLPTPIRHRPHPSSSSIARFNSSRSTLTMSATSRIDRDIPPAVSQRTNTGTRSGGQCARA